MAIPTVSNVSEGQVGDRVSMMNCTSGNETKTAFRASHGIRVVRFGNRQVRENTAFTLIELLIVTAILSVVIGVIAACLAGGIRVWDSARSFARLEKDTAYALRIVERDVANALPLPNLGFEGSETEMRFPLRIAADGAPAMGDVVYAYDPLAGTLVRRLEPYREGKDSRLPERLLTGVAAAAFRYSALQRSDGGGRAWQSMGPSTTNFPGRIELAVELADGERRMIVRREMMLPMVVGR